MFESALQAILTALGAIVVGGGGLGLIVYGIFKVLGEKWLNTKFDERLATYRHAQQRELEELRFQINKLMDRTVKLHQREFDVLPETWGRLTDAYNVIHPVALGFQMSPNFERMSAPQFEHFLENSLLAEWQREEMKIAVDRQRYYTDAMMWYHLNNAGSEYVKFHDYLKKNGIFIPEPIKTRFLELDTLLYDAYLERRSSMQHREAPQKFDKGGALHENGPALLNALEQDVQGRLWNTNSS